MSGRALWVAIGAAFLAVGPSARPAVGQDTIPAGYGTLTRDDIVVRFTTGTVEVHFLPLDEQVIRLLATDTYRSLTQLIRSRHDDIVAAAERAGGG
ncbi:MAG TPA: hypothetical protein VN908_02270, partial [Gemmatimonadales bacterium]|nr:hypothetical protein [Gemmatimonadales bacterium]